jgi:hypothetical protein
VVGKGLGWGRRAWFGRWKVHSGAVVGPSRSTQSMLLGTDRLGTQLRRTAGFRLAVQKTVPRPGLPFQNHCKVVVRDISEGQACCTSTSS